MFPFLKVARKTLRGLSAASLFLALWAVSSAIPQEPVDRAKGSATPYIEIAQVPDRSSRINIYQITIFFPERTPTHRGIEGTSLSAGTTPAGEEKITLVVEVSGNYSHDRMEDDVLLRTAYYYERGGIFASSRRLEEVEDIRDISVDRYTRGISVGRFELLPEEKFLLGSSEISQLMIMVKERSEQDL